MRKIQINILVTLVSLLLFGCKKYPENTLILKRPFVLISAHPWYLEQFTVNGSDSTNHNSRVFVTGGLWFEEHPDSKLFKKYSDRIRIENDHHYTGSWDLSSNKKEIRIKLLSDFNGFTNDTTCPCYNYLNIFVVYNKELTWKIEKLSKKQFWLSTQYNGTDYYIKFKQ